MDIEATADSRGLGRDRMFEKQHDYREVTHPIWNVGMTPSATMMGAYKDGERIFKLSDLQFLAALLYCHVKQRSQS